MGKQILGRRANGQSALSTLADNTSVTLDGVHATLGDPAYLFEYEAQGLFGGIDMGDLLAGSGLTFALIRSDLSDSDLDTILSGTVITKEVMNTEIPSRQRLFAIGVMELAAIATQGYGNWKIKFTAPKGGIPFVEGSGWKLVFINRIGVAMTTGGFLMVQRQKHRFAYGGY